MFSHNEGRINTAMFVLTGLNLHVRTSLQITECLHMRETIDVHVFTGITNPSLTYKAILEKNKHSSRGMSE